MARIEDLTAEHAPLEWDTPLFRQAITQYEQALPHAAVDDAVAERLRAEGLRPVQHWVPDLRDPRVREAIKEIAQLDGAFVVSRDGTVEAACQLIDAPNTGLTLPKGLGTRHWAAAAITNVTTALGVVVSQSTGTVRLFQKGEIILRIAPMRHARAMKWHEHEVEPAPSRAD